MAPPPRSRLGTPIALPAPPQATQLTHHTRQRRSDLPTASIDDKEEQDKISSTESESSESGSNISSTDDKDEGIFFFIHIFI